MDRQETQRLIPIIIKISERAQKDVRILMEDLEKARQIGELETMAVEDKIEAVMDQWREQVTRLGGQPKGVWSVDFDNGAGYFCWKYPEREILFEHGYQDGYLGRRPLPPLVTLPVVLENEA